MNRNDLKTALLLCATHNDLGLIKALRKLGYFIIATGTRIDRLGKAWVDKWISADYSDKDLILDIAKKEQIDVICQCCNDFGVYTASFVAEKLGLPGYDSYQTTLTLHNKDLFKKFALENDILTPTANYYISPDAAVEDIAQMDLPVMIKPVDASAGNGISRVEKKDGIKAAVDYAFQKSKEGRIVAEPYLSGKQYGFCTFLVNKKVVAVASNNEYSIVNPYRVEIDTWPADTFEECRDFLISEIEKMADILNLKDGIFHLQYIYSDGKPYIIEVMRRVLGNMYSVPANELNGFDWDYWETRAKCGLDCSGFPKDSVQEGYYAYKTLMANHNGKIAAIDIPKEYEKFIYNKYILKCPGDRVEDHMREPVGFLFMMFASPDEMEDVLIGNYRGDIVQIKG